MVCFFGRKRLIKKEVIILSIFSTKSVSIVYYIDFVFGADYAR